MVGLVLMLFWASLAHFILLDILGLFHFLGHPRPISILHSYGFLLSLSGFPAQITNPIFLVSSFRLIRPIFAYFPFLIMPMGLLLLSSGSLAFFEALLLFYRPMDHYSCHSGTMVFSSTC